MQEIDRELKEFEKQMEEEAQQKKAAKAAAREEAWRQMIIHASRERPHIKLPDGRIVYKYTDAKGRRCDVIVHRKGLNLHKGKKKAVHKAPKAPKAIESRDPLGEALGTM